MRTWSSREILLLAMVVSLGMITTACRRNVEGTYSNENGFAILELRSGGEATFTLMGEAAPCTYEVDEGRAQITLECEGENIVFTLHDDGSLTGPPGNMFGALRKSES